MMDGFDFHAALSRFGKVRMLVIGDVMLDRFIFGAAERLSPEAPVPILRVRQQQTSVGGAANVARNLAALGAQVTIIGVVGADPEAETVQSHLEGTPNVQPMLISSPERPTTTKIRFISGAQHILRADTEVDTEISATTELDILTKVREVLPGCDAIVLSDYAKGILTASLTRSVIELAHSHHVPVFVDPKGKDYARYAGATVITPNRLELSEAVGRRLATTADFHAAADHLIEQFGFSSILVTLSEDGMMLVRRGHEPVLLESEARRVVDVSGAGDTVVSVFSLGWSAKLVPDEAARLANIAAGIVVGKRGTASIALRELESRVLQSRMNDAQIKLRSLPDMVQLVEDWRHDGLTVGFTNGCFDLLHPGHVSLLQEARRLCDRLIVGLNADVSVSRLKGPTRPIQNELARATVLSSLACVDAVVIFEEDTPLEAIIAIRPSVLIKGADYKREEVVGYREVIEAGGKVQLVKLTPNQSTTGLVAKAGNGLRIVG